MRALYSFNQGLMTPEGYISIFIERISYLSSSAKRCFACPVSDTLSHADSIGINITSVVVSMFYSRILRRGMIWRQS